MVKTSTVALAKSATGWSTMVLAAQVALSPVTASPLNVTTLADKRSAPLEKRNYSFTLTFYSEPSCSGDGYIRLEGGNGNAGHSSCFVPYDPSSGEPRCAKAVKFQLYSGWTGNDFHLWLSDRDNCDGDLLDSSIEVGRNRWTCMVYEDSCVNSAFATWY